MDAKDRWRNILKKREQLREQIAALEQMEEQAEREQSEAERRNALLTVAETELQSVSQGAPVPLDMNPWSRHNCNMTEH